MWVMNRYNAGEFWEVYHESLSQWLGQGSLENVGMIMMFIFQREKVELNLTSLKSKGGRAKLKDYIKLSLKIYRAIIFNQIREVY